MIISYFYQLQKAFIFPTSCRIFTSLQVEHNPLTTVVWSTEVFYLSVFPPFRHKNIVADSVKDLYKIGVNDIYCSRFIHNSRHCIKEGYQDGQTWFLLLLQINILLFLLVNPLIFCSWILFSLMCPETVSKMTCSMIFPRTKVNMTCLYFPVLFFWPFLTALNFPCH